MIVKNEEETLSRCLDSVRKIFNEIIIVDTGSSDRTKEIAKKYTDKIYDFKWVNDFSKARNYAFSKATKDYIMWLDADDIVKKEDLKKLIALKKLMGSKVDIVMTKYNIAFDSEGNPTFSYYRERIFKREKDYKWNDRVHEYIALSGNIIKEDIAITHNKQVKNKSTRNLEIYQEMENNKETFTPRNLYYYGRELYDHQKYEDSIVYLIKFLETKKGWLEDNISACYLIFNCYCFLNTKETAVIWLYKTFEYDIPRKKTCCLIGNILMENNQYNLAIYWYNQALTLPKNDEQGFYESDYDYFIPYINLCACYYQLDKIPEAEYYHKLTEEIKPHSETVKYNSKFFENKNESEI